MATKATTKRLTIARNSIGRPRVRWQGIGKRWHVYCVVEGDEEADYSLTGVVQSVLHAKQLKNRIAGEGTIDPKRWTRMEQIANPFEVVK